MGRLTLRPHRRNTQSTVKGAPGIFTFYSYTFVLSGVSRLWLFLFVKACLMYLNTMAKKKNKSESENAGQRLTMAMIDKDRPPRILVDSGFLPKFTVKFHQLFKCYLENRNAAVLFYHKPFTKIDWCNIPCSGGGCWGQSCY